MEKSRTTESGLNVHSGHDFVITRLIDASPVEVFRAWTDPSLMVHWWGPHDCTNPVCEMDVRPGGAFRIVTRSPDGNDYPLAGTYLDVAAPGRLLLADRTAGGSEPETVNDITFGNRNGKTLLTIRTTFASEALRNALVTLPVAEGWAHTLKRLELLLHSASHHR